MRNSLGTFLTFSSVALAILVLLANPLPLFATNNVADAAILPAPDNDPPDTSGVFDAIMEEIIQLLGALGVGPVITLLVQLLKRFGLAPDGTSGKWTWVLSAGVLALLVVFGVYTGFDVSAEFPQMVLAALVALLKIALQVKSASITYNDLRSSETIGRVDLTFFGRAR